MDKEREGGTEIDTEREREWAMRETECRGGQIKELIEA